MTSIATEADPITHAGSAPIPEEAKVGPYCVGTRERHQIVHPADFARRLDELRINNDARWWLRTAAALEQAARSGTSRLNHDRCAELAHAIISGLQGILPMAFAAAAGLITATHARAELPRRVRATAYMLARERGYIVDRAPIKTIIEALKIDRRTWHRWKKIEEKETADDFLYLSLCESALHQELGRPWARLAVLVALQLANDQQARELHLARGGRIVTGRDGQEVFVMGDGPLDPDI